MQYSSLNWITILKLPLENQVNRRKIGSFFNQTLSLGSESVLWKFCWFWSSQDCHVNRKTEAAAPQIETVLHVNYLCLPTCHSGGQMKISLRSMFFGWDNEHFQWIDDQNRIFPKVVPLSQTTENSHSPNMLIICHSWLNIYLSKIAQSDTILHRLRQRLVRKSSLPSHSPSLSCGGGKWKNKWNNMKIEIKRSQNVKEGGGLFVNRTWSNIAAFRLCPNYYIYKQLCGQRTSPKHMCVWACSASQKMLRMEEAKWREERNGNESGCKIKFTVLSIRFATSTTTRSPKCTHWRLERERKEEKNSRLSLVLN